MPCCCRGRRREALLPKLVRDGVVELDGASVRRLGKAAV